MSVDAGDGFTAKQRRRRAEIAEAGAARLLTEAVPRLLASVAPAALAEACGVSPDTVHRLVGGRDAVLELVCSEVVTNLEYRSETWPSFSDVTSEAAEAFVAGLAEEDDKTSAFIDALKVYIDVNFTTPARPAGTLIEAAVLVSSPRWAGPDYLDADLVPVAERLRALRVDHLRKTTEGLGWLLAEAMAQLERRPQRGMTPSTLITLMNCLVDGALLRMMIDPDSLDTRTVAEALLRLGMAYTEPGSFDDPHEPDDPHGQAVFAQIVDAATGRWRDGAIGLDDVAAVVPGIDLATVQRWFPTVHDLADSVVRRKVASVKPEPSESTDALVATLESVLRRLCLTADDIPGAVHEAFSSDAPTSIARQITEHAMAVVEALDQPALLAEQLVSDACEGSTMWPRTQTLLRLLEPR